MLLAVGYTRDRFRRIDAGRPASAQVAYSCPILAAWQCQPSGSKLTGRYRPISIGQGQLQLPSRADAELGEHLAQVPFDGTGADE